MFRLFKKLSSMTMMQRLVFVVCPVMLVVLVYVVVNLFNWSVVRGEEMEGRAARQQLSDSTIKATRGTIYDTNMNVLAQSATAWNVIIDPATIDEEFDKQIASAQENEQPGPPHVVSGASIVVPQQDCAVAQLPGEVLQPGKTPV